MDDAGCGVVGLRTDASTHLAAQLPVAMTLLASQRSAGIARGVLRSALSGHLVPEVLGDVELLTSELIANVAAASGDACVLRVSVPDGDVMRISVADPDPCPPVLRDADPLAEHGRGLSIIEALALRWGVDFSDTGKTVWFEVQSTGP